MLNISKYKNLLIVGILSLIIIVLFAIGGLMLIINNNKTDKSVVNNKDQEIVFLENNKTIPSNNDVILKGAEIKDGILKLKITYGGCENPVFSLYVSPVITDSEPPIITATIVRVFSGDSCDRLNESEVSFSIDPIVNKFNLADKKFELSIVDSQNNNFTLVSVGADSNICSSELALFDEYIEASKLPIIENPDSLCHATNVSTDFLNIPPKWATGKLIAIQDDLFYGFVFQGSKNMDTVIIPMTESEKMDYEIGQYYKIDMMNICRYGMMIADSMSPSKISGTFVKPVKVTCENSNDLNFIFRYGVEGKNEMNTYTGVYTKDMVIDPPVTTQLVLSPTELQKIYNKAKELGIFEIKETKKKNTDNMDTTPCSSYYLKFSSSDLKGEVSWDDCKGELKDQFVEFSNFIINIIQNREEYKKMPESKGGYM